MTRPAELPALRFVVSLFCFVALIHVTAVGASAQRFTFQHYEQDEGLKNRDVFKLMQDKTGFLWSATENGIFRYDGAEFHHFGAADGIQESMVIDVYQDASGRIWTAGTDHLYYLADRGWLWVGTDLDVTLFRYRLLGLEPAWSSTTAHRLRYPAIPPENYRFEIQAIDPDRQRQSAVVSLNVSIRPPWWKTHIFYLVLAILSFTSCVLIWQWREHRLIKRQQLLEQLIAQRTSELEAEKMELLTAREALHKQATHDALTDLWNRSAILDILQSEFDRARHEDTRLPLFWPTSTTSRKSMTPSAISPET